MTNYNERIDEILFNLCDLSYASFATQEEADRVADQLDYDRQEAKQALNSLIKELVAEAKPSKKTDTRGATQNPNNAFYHTKKAQGYNEAIDQFEQNLLKALEEV